MNVIKLSVDEMREKIVEYKKMEEELKELLEKFDESFDNLFANWIDNRVDAYENQYLEFRNSTVDMIRLCEQIAYDIETTSRCIAEADEAASMKFYK